MLGICRELHFTGRRAHKTVLTLDYFIKYLILFVYIQSSLCGQEKPLRFTQQSKSISVTVFGSETFLTNYLFSQELRINLSYIFERLMILREFD